LENSGTFCFGLAAAFLVACEPVFAQMYSWKDPASGQTRFSNIAPPWYSRGEIVSGPRVIATIGDRVIDDTALAYEQRLRLSGKSRDYVDKLRAQKQQGPAAPQDPGRGAARTQAAGARPAYRTATRGLAGAHRGS
jgi:hypothetical protein